MGPVTEGQLRFTFPAEWTGSKFDDWAFYRSQFMKLAAAELDCSKCGLALKCASCQSGRVAGTRGIDILAIDGETTCWQIEVKDYRQARTSNFLFLADEVALKVRDTLAALVSARLNANDPQERNQAVQAIRCGRIRIVLHLEMPTPGSGIHSKKPQMADVLQRLKQLVKAIDPRPMVVDRQSSANLPWTVDQIGVPPR